MCLFGVAPSVCVCLFDQGVLVWLLLQPLLLVHVYPFEFVLLPKNALFFFCSLLAGLCHSDFQEKPKTRQRTARNTEKREKTTTKKQQQLHIMRKKDPKTKTLDCVLPASVNLSLSAMALGPRVSPTSPCWYPMLTLMAYWTMCLNARMMSRRRCLTKPKLTILKRKQQCELRQRVTSEVRASVAADNEVCWAPKYHPPSAEERAVEERFKQSCMRSIIDFLGYSALPRQG